LKNKLPSQLIKVRKVQSVGAGKGKFILCRLSHLEDCAGDFGFCNLDEFVVFDLDCSKLASLLTADKCEPVKHTDGEDVPLQVYLAFDFEVFHLHHVELVLGPDVKNAFMD
jgi:hypothetical protein